ncbi:MAG: ribonuclease H-like domain-containing protein [Lachnospiraceae bacterium]|nr:ribonuclease H-like domain-containing protein [Lachnospiraceae bacterium]
MKIFTRQLSHMDIATSALSDILYFDIETTGLSAQNNRIYLIGCAVHDGQGFLITQWFDDTGNEEKQILSSFFIYAAGFGRLINYNGNRFDIPFLQKRAAVYGLKDTLSDMVSLDLYKEIVPYKNLLGVSDCKQQTIESLFASGRTDHTSGGELTEVYKNYLAGGGSRAEEEKLLIGHNEADLEGLISITPVLAFHDLPESKLTVYKALVNTYTDFSGARQHELLLHFRSEKSAPLQIHTVMERCHLTLFLNEGLIKVPLIQAELKYYYAGYKDYYYLPDEDMALHKSIAGFVESSHRVQATASTCYTRKRSVFLPQWDIFIEPFYKYELQDTKSFFELRDEMKKNREFFSSYAEYLFRYMIKNS